MLGIVLVITATGGLEDTFRRFSEDKLPYVGNDPSDVWRAYIPGHPPVDQRTDSSFVLSVRTIGIAYGFDVSSKAIGGVYVGSHAENNIFTRTHGQFWNKTEDVFHYDQPGQQISRLSVLEVAGTLPTLLCPCGHGTICTTPPDNLLPPICLTAPLDHDRQEDVIGTVIIVLAAITVLVGFAVHSFE